MAVHHQGSGRQFSFNVHSEYHVTTIAIVSYPLKVEPNKEFQVEMAVMCREKGCDLMGKIIRVYDDKGNVKGSGTLTIRAFNARYGKNEYHGKVKVRSPAELGSYTWFGRFPPQSRHLGSQSRIGIRL